jgi:hypothetical protein
MMLGCKYYISHAGIPGRLDPVLRVKIIRIEAELKFFVGSLVVKIIGCKGSLSLGPSFILRTNTPAFYNSPLAISAPMHEQSKLQILPLIELPLNKAVRGSNVIFLAKGENNAKK